MVCSGILTMCWFWTSSPPVIPVYDDEGWNVEAPPPNADLAHYDASFYLVRVTAPADLTVVASGVEIGREREGREQILTFAAGPVRDFYIAASDRYVVVSKTVGEATINCYTVAGLEDDRAEMVLSISSVRRCRRWGWSIPA